VLALIERKAAGEDIVAPATPEEPAKVLDLMAALEASLARTGAKQTGGGSATERAATKRAATKTAAKKAAAKKAPVKKKAAKKATGAAKRTRKSA
jgi:DNA end-binding protein Ku